MARDCDGVCRVVLSLEPCEAALRSLSETLVVGAWLRDEFWEALLLEGGATGLEACRRDLRVCDSVEGLEGCR